MTAPTTSATPKIALDQRASSRHDNARRMTLSAPGGGLYPTSSSTQYCEPEVTAAGGIYVDVPPTGAHVDGNLVSAKGWPGLAAFIRECLAVLGTKIIHSDQPVAAAKISRLIAS
jgi:putative intracellular protease/amidase